ncbi:sigma-70 family RNA polymerase sigma factor [Caenispirillum bisanense]
MRQADGIVKDHGLAEDIVQDAFLRLDRRGDPAAAGSGAVKDPAAYLQLVVRNLAIDACRRLGRERAWIDQGDGLDAAAPADQPNPEAAAIARDDLRLLEAALAELPERTRVALTMHRFGDHRLADIAAHLGVSVGTAHALVTDGLEHCRRRLGRS